MTRGRLFLSSLAVLTAAGAAEPLIDVAGAAITIWRTQREVLDTNGLCEEFAAAGSDSLAAIHDVVRRDRWVVRIAQPNDSTFDISVAARSADAPIVVATVGRGWTSH
jgi:hypothetical protein